MDERDDEPVDKVKAELTAISFIIETLEETLVDGTLFGLDIPHSWHPTVEEYVRSTIDHLTDEAAYIQGG